MIHTNASSVELVDVEQVELVRGGQSALFGRNALGGIVNVASSRPSLTKMDRSISACRSETTDRSKVAARSRVR